MLDMNWVAIGVTAVCAAGASATAVHWFLSQRLRERERRLTVAAQEHVTQGTSQLRAAMTKLQLELEKERVSSRQRVAAGIAEERAQVARLQSQLKLAYAQLDRLRAEIEPTPARPRAETTSGFAVTMPFVDDRR